MASSGVEVLEWDWDLRTLPEFEVDCLDYVSSTKEEDRAPAVYSAVLT